ncbi:MAG: hypothetical protein HN576_02835 [Bacteriovoracaceae bacterium]|nr:hypothetical protein [Bacteriovoracaceae bacterium]
MKEFFLIFLFSTTTIIAEEFIIKHPTCSTKYVENPTHQPDFKKAIKKVIESRKYKLTVFKKHAKISEGDLYFIINLSRSKSILFKDCIVKVSLKTANSRHMSSRDKVIATKKIKRKFPRVTREGNERCLKALHDAFIHIPNCKSGL